MAARICHLEAVLTEAERRQYYEAVDAYKDKKKSKRPSARTRLHILELVMIGKR